MGSRKQANGLTVITICKDNPTDLRLTLQSVWHQSVRPERHLIIDGSNSNMRDEMAAIVLEYDAEYVWSTPRGIYRAMAEGLEDVDPSHLVWFLNATDRFVSATAIETLLESVEHNELTRRTTWLVGQTAEVGPPAHLLRFSASAGNYAHALRAGKVGLPHSSTIVGCSALKEVQAFSGPDRISKDYEMALKLISRFGPPTLVHEPLSLYDVTGESAKHAWRNVLHKSEARIKNQPWWHLPAEPFRILAAGRREILRRRLRKNPENERLWRALGWERIDPDMAKPFWEREGS